MDIIRDIYFEPKAFGESSKMTLNNVIKESRANHINQHSLFALYFNYIPNKIEEVLINCPKAAALFVQKFKNEIKDSFYKKGYSYENRKDDYLTICFVAFEDLLIEFDSINNRVTILFRKTKMNIIDMLIAEFRKSKKRIYRRRDPEISLLLNLNGNLVLKTFTINKPKLNIECNYNEDFEVVHKHILKSLSEKNKKGLVLLHGKPGTGKTYYIRHLIASMKKKVIFLSPDVAMELTSPTLLPILIDNPNSIIVIEDAEKIITSRNNNENSNVAALLNIADGLLSDFLNIQIICSFNTDISKIDTALLRKGRLIAKYDFRELKVDKANKLAQKLGLDKVYNELVTLSSIYNHSEVDFSESKRNKIGFGVLN